MKIKPLNDELRMKISRERKTNKVWNYIVEFGKTTTLHGITHLVAADRHWIELLVWGAAVILSFVGSTLLIYNSWFRFYTNPTVISLQKDYRTWNLPFPAATVCFINKLDKTLASKFISRNWNDIDESRHDYLLSFLDSVANTQYGTLENFIQFRNDKELENLNLIDIVPQITVKMVYHATIFDPKYKDMDFIETTTEMGVCYTYSGVLSQYLTFQSNKNNYLNDSFKPPHCNFLTSLCYARIEDLPVNMTYYIHSPYEMPDIRWKHFSVMQSTERDTTFRFLETISSKELKSLTPDQRKCRFSDEPLDNWNIKQYSYNVCLMECRRQLAHQLCGCAPHFYKKHDKIPVCGVAGLACLSQYTESLVTLNHNGHSVKCNCLPSCEDINLYVDKDTSREWSYPVPCNIRFRWAIELYNKTQLRRDIIFGVEDLLVSFGGTAALFLGCSLLTFVEIFYFFGLRLFWYICK